MYKGNSRFERQTINMSGSRQCSTIVQEETEGGGRRSGSQTRKRNLKSEKEIEFAFRLDQLNSNLSPNAV